MLYLYERRPKKTKKKYFWDVLLALPRFCRKEYFLQNGGQERKTPQKSFFFAFLVFFHIDTTYIKLEWNFENFLIFWCTLVARVSWDNMSTSLSWDNMSPGQYVTGTICHWDNMSQDKMSPQYS